MKFETQVEMFEGEVISDYRDSLLYMNFRREINSSFAEHPVDFNAEGLWAGQLALGRSFTGNDLIVDIGSGSGKVISEAASKMNVQARLICVEPSIENVSPYLRSVRPSYPQTLLLRAVGENLPLRDNSAEGATLHNSIFRADDALTMLGEAKRVVKPGGFIAISSNAIGHAYYRHLFEEQVALKVIEQTGTEIEVPKPPAEGHYLEDLPRLINQAGQLEILEDLFVGQDTKAIITDGQRLVFYLESINFSAANVEMPAELREVWRRTVENYVYPYIQSKIAEAKVFNETAGSNEEPYFADPIKRGMFVLLNKK